MSTLAERIRIRQINYRNEISKIGTTLAKLTSILIRLEEDGIVCLEEKDIQYLRMCSIEINTDPTIY